MQNDHRLKQLESKMNGTQRALVWLKRQQEVGGYIQLARRGMEPGVLDRFIIDDQDSAFVFDCIGVCNIHAFQSASYGDDVAVRALYLVRLLRSKDTPEENELRPCRLILKNFTLEGLALAGAIQAISEQYFEGHKVLFKDTEKGLVDRNAVARELCDMFNEIVPIYEVEPITTAELDEAVEVEAPKVEDILVSLTRAQVNLQLGDGLGMRRWLLPILRSAG